MRKMDALQRVVIKIGTNCLSLGNSIDLDYLSNIARQTTELTKQNLRPLIVSSGAIGMGAGELAIKERITNIEMRQACAAIGQPLLMHRYREAFAPFGITVAQTLLTREVLNKRKSYTNLKRSVEALLDLKIIPIFNENDSVATDEIGTAFGDNDSLSALIASKVDAQLLIMLSDIAGLYDKDPRKNEDARLIHTVPKIDEKIISYAGKAGTTFSTGGMKTKLDAVAIAQRAGCDVIIADGRERDILPRLISGEELGTIFLAKEKLKNKTRWILHSTPEGNITVDEGALKALRKHKSLLPSGVVRIEGMFEAGSVVTVNNSIKIQTAFNSQELEQLKGKHSSEIRELLGPTRPEVIARPEEMAFPDGEEAE